VLRLLAVGRRGAAGSQRLTRRSRARSAGNATCLAALRNFTTTLLAPHTARLLAGLNGTAAPRASSAAGGELSSAFLGRLSKARVGRRRGWLSLVLIG